MPPPGRGDRDGALPENGLLPGLGDGPRLGSGLGFGVDSVGSTAGAEAAGSDATFSGASLDAAGASDLEGALLGLAFGSSLERTVPAGARRDGGLSPESPAGLRVDPLGAGLRTELPLGARFGAPAAASPDEP